VPVVDSSTIFSETGLVVVLETPILRMFPPPAAPEYKLMTGSVVEPAVVLAPVEKIFIVDESYDEK
jgi:hypothetical protein